jgi:CubicO group peptidase (beta-lactamase class C family)
MPGRSFGPSMRRTAVLLLAHFLVGAGALSAQATQYVPDARNWERRTPQQVGLDAAAIDSAVAFAVASESASPRDLLAQHLRTFGRTGVAFAAFEVLDLFESEHNRRVTWDHLLRQTSDWQGTLWGKPDWADRPRGDVEEWRAGPRDEPGTVYAYNDVRVNLLALAALNVWRRPLPQVLREHGHGSHRRIRHVALVRLRQLLGGAGRRARAVGQRRRALGRRHVHQRPRHGALRAAHGAPRPVGRPPDPVRAVAPHGDDARAPQPTQYGFMNFFLNTGRRALPSAPEQAFYHLGAGNNVIYVDPVNDIVIVGA